MECREALELLSDEMDGRLSAAGAERLSGHVAACADCAAAKRSLASMRAAFRAAPREKAPPGFADGVMAALPRGRVRSFPRTLGWIAAAAAVVVVAVSLIPRDEPRVEREVAKARGWDDAAAPQGAADGSRVQVAAESAAPAEKPAPVAAPVAPPRPDIGLASRDEFEKAGADTAKQTKKAEEEAPAPAKPMESAPPAEPAAGPPPPAAGEESRKNEDDLATATRQRSDARAKNVRYVVFKDAAAADRFAASLATDGGRVTKEKSAQPAPLPPPAPSGGAGGGAGGGGYAPKPSAPKSEAKLDANEKQPAPSDLLKEASFRARRIVARTPVTSLGESDLVALAAAAGGALVPLSDDERFAELLDGAAVAEDADGDTKRRAGARGAAAPQAGKPAPGEDAKDQAAALGATAAGGKAASVVVVVVVVLEQPAAPAKK